MKPEKQQEAIRLRESGKSIKEIEALIGCSRSSISVWVRNVPLTDEQKRVLIERTPAYKAQFYGAEATAKMFQAKRDQYRKEGAETAIQNDPLHIAVCMLYWAEGTKSVHRARITNSDPKIIRLFILFAKKYFHVRDEDLTISIKCYTDFHRLEEIQDYWLKETGLPKSCLRKGIVNYYLPTTKDLYSKGTRKKKCEYGTCHLSALKGSRIVQHIYGAIEKYSSTLVV